MKSPSQSTNTGKIKPETEPQVAAVLPATLEELRALIVRRHADMPRRIAQVAEYSNANPEEVALGPVTRIAHLAGVQPSTLVRFAQFLGYPGFSDLQEVFRTNIRDRRPTYDERLSDLRDRNADGTDRLFDGISEAAVSSILSARESADVARIDAAAAVLAAADTIFILGQRRAFPAAAYVAYLFGQLGLRHHLATNVGALAPEELSTARTGDAILAISFAPYFPPTVELTADAQARDIPVVAITDSPFSPLASDAATWLEVIEADFAGFRSLSATFCVAATLAITTAERHGLV